MPNTLTRRARSVSTLQHAARVVAVEPIDETHRTLAAELLSASVDAARLFEIVDAAIDEHGDPAGGLTAVWCASALVVAGYDG